MKAKMAKDKMKMKAKGRMSLKPSKVKTVIGEGYGKIAKGEIKKKK